MCSVQPQHLGHNSWGHIISHLNFWDKRALFQCNRYLRVLLAKLYLKVWAIPATPGVLPDYAYGFVYSKNIPDEYRGPILIVCGEHAILESTLTNLINTYESVTIDEAATWMLCNNTNAAYKVKINSRGFMGYNYMKLNFTRFKYYNKSLELLRGDITDITECVNWCIRGRKKSCAVNYITPEIDYMLRLSHYIVYLLLIDYYVVPESYKNLIPDMLLISPWPYANHKNRYNILKLTPERIASTLIKYPRDDLINYLSSHDNALAGIYKHLRNINTDTRSVSTGFAARLDSKYDQIEHLQVIKITGIYDT